MLIVPPQVEGLPDILNVYLRRRVIWVFVECRPAALCRMPFHCEVEPCAPAGAKRRRLRTKQTLVLAPDASAGHPNLPLAFARRTSRERADTAGGNGLPDGPSAPKRARFMFAGKKYTCNSKHDVAMYRKALQEKRQSQKRWCGNDWGAAVLTISKQFTENQHGGVRLRKGNKKGAVPAEEKASSEALPAPAGASQSALGDRGTRREKITDAHQMMPRPSDAGNLSQNVVPGVSLGSTAVGRLHFRVHGLLGEGAYGVVYRATLSSPPAFAGPLDRPPGCLSSGSGPGKAVAIKVVRKRAGDAAAVDVQKREIHFLKSLAGHPCIVKLIAWRENAFDLQMFFEYCESDLRALIREGDLSAPSAKSLGKQLLSAVRYTHSQSIIHRDIKPHNIFVRRSHLGTLRLFLGDFGLASAIGERSTSAIGENIGPLQSTSLTATVATLYYRAPEVMLCKGGYYYPMDVWSVGVTMAEMEQGSPPFIAETEKEILKKIFFVLGGASQITWPSLPLATLRKVVATFGNCPRKLPGEWPWGKRFGTEFQTFSQIFFQLEPSARNMKDAEDHEWLRPLAMGHA